MSDEEILVPDAAPSASPVEMAMIRSILGHCQSLGLAPLKDCEHVVLWVQARRYEFAVQHEGLYRGSIPLYKIEGERLARCQVGRPFHSNNPLLLHATPLDVADAAYHNYPVNMLAALVAISDLRLPPDVDETEAVFTAQGWLPIAAYEVEHMWNKEGKPYEYRLLEGEDPLQELTAPYVDDPGWDDPVRLRSRPEGCPEALWSQIVEAWDGERAPCGQLATRICLTRWQAKGLMPEVEPGKVLVWKYVKHPDPSKEDGSPARYRGALNAPYDVNQPYCYAGSMACAGPIGAGRSYIKADKPGMVMAILADINLLFGARHFTEGAFYALQGVPVACYDATRVNEEEFDFQLIEGRDAFAWLD